MTKNKPHNHCILIAEIGINHNGDIAIAKQLIDQAKIHGWDYVKFQKRDIETVYTKAVLDTPRESPWGTTTRQQKQGLEFGAAEYEEIDRYCRQVGVKWFGSAWDLKSLAFLEKFRPDYHKVASAMLTHTEFLTAVAKLKRHTIISTGMATYKEIDRAVEIFKKEGTAFTLLHTVSTYPCEDSKANVGVMLTLQEKYNCPVGYSGHEVGTSPTLLAAALGATMIERHVTMSRAMYGSDQAASLEPKGMEFISKFTRAFPQVYGTGEKTYDNDEQKVASKLRYFENQ